MLCCAVLCYAVLCCAVLCYSIRCYDLEAIGSDYAGTMLQSMGVPEATA